MAFYPDTGVGITGITGPGGAEPDKPVGTVYIASDTSSRSFYRYYVFPGARTPVRQGAANAALHMYLENTFSPGNGFGKINQEGG